MKRPHFIQCLCRRVIWLRTPEPVKGYFVTFPAITMHAISQEPQPCIYAQLEPPSNDNNDSNDEGDEELYPEIRLIPSEPDKCESTLASNWVDTASHSCADAQPWYVTAVQEIFETLCQCAALNPDPVDEGDCSSPYCAQLGSCCTLLQTCTPFWSNSGSDVVALLSCQEAS